MGQYKSRPATLSVQELWRDECRKAYMMVSDQMAAVSENRFAPTDDGDSDGLEPADEWTPMHLHAFRGGDPADAPWEFAEGAADSRSRSHGRSGSGKSGSAASSAESSNAAAKGTGLTPLHVCCSRPTRAHAALAAELLRRGASPREQCRKGFLPAHYAAANGCADALAALVAAGSPLSAGAHGVTPLHVAAMHGHTAEVAVLLDADGGGAPGDAIVLEAADSNGFSALHMAAWFGNYDVCARLIDAGAAVDCSTAAGETPLMLAADGGHYQVVSAMLRAGAAVDAQDDEGNTSVHTCCRRGDVRVLELLLSFGAGEESLGTLNLYNDTPLHVACYSGRVEIFTHIFGETRLDISELLRAENVFSETALHAAATCGRSPLLVATLLQQGVDVNVRGRDGHTSLHSACWHGNLEVANILLVNGADIRLRTRDGGETVIQWCHCKGYDSLLDVLELHAIRLVQALQAGDPPTAPTDAEGLEDLFAELTGLPKPSPLGRIRSALKKQHDVSALKNLLPQRLQVPASQISVVDQIAQGSFGKVFRATFRGQVVAVKKYRQDHFHAKSNLDMFCREVQILHKLDHPNILRLVGAVTESPSKFAILTEYVDGDNLFDALHEKRVGFDFATRVAIAKGVACGMAHMHGLPSPVIHRDLNSHNVLLYSTNRPVIADFGESRFFADGRPLADVKDLTLQPGNLRWMAPEIFVQNSVYTLLADVFSYALLLWELLTGHIPFAELKAASAAAQMAYHNQRPGVPATCPAPIAALLRRAWSHDARSRPPFADVVAWLDLHYAGLLGAGAGGVDGTTAARLEAAFRDASAVAAAAAAAGATEENSRGYVANFAAAAAAAAGGGGGGGGGKAGSAAPPR